ncbi:MAG: hypothetical protein J6A75_12835 [Lachnospiraceae bacterium]|nr:hypothetical protein [Lachnospiraceae bacterium]
MKDLIDERNFKEMCSRSIVKSYNVHYMTQEEIDAKKLAERENDEDKKAVNLQKSAEKKEKPVLVSDQLQVFDDEDPVTREQIERILGEREDSFNEQLKMAVDAYGE